MQCDRQGLGKFRRSVIGSVGTMLDADNSLVREPNTDEQCGAALSGIRAGDVR
jgi:hypothetical protein